MERAKRSGRGRAAVPARKQGRRLLLTLGLVESICRHVRKGIMPWVAAEEFGVSRRTVFRWLEQAREIDERLERLDDYQPTAEEELFLHFLHSIHAAAGRARGTAESWAWKHKPDWWLAHGGGRDQPDAPGWRVSDPERQPERRGELDELMVEALRELGMGEPRVVPSIVAPVDSHEEPDSDFRESVNPGVGGEAE